MTSIDDQYPLDKPYKQVGKIPFQNQGLQLFQTYVLKVTPNVIGTVPFPTATITVYLGKYGKRLYCRHPESSKIAVIQFWHWHGHFIDSQIQLMYNVP